MPRKGTTKSEATAQLALTDFGAYNPQMLKAFTNKQLRQEYSRLRSIARKRLEAIKKDSEFIKSDVYTINKEKYTPLSEIKTEAQLRFKLTELSRFIVAKRSSLSGLRRVKAAQLEWLSNNAPFAMDKPAQFFEFMEYMRVINKGNRNYDSNDTVDFYEEQTEENSNLTTQELQERYKIWEADMAFQKKEKILNKIPQNSDSLRGTRVTYSR